MHGTADQLDLNPPSDPRWGRPLALALAAHGVLVAALTWGVSWRPDTTEVAVEAELWSRLPQEAAPRLVAPEPAPEPEPAPKPQPVTPPPPPAPTPAPPPAPAPAPVPSKADIALEAKKKLEQKKLEEKQRAEAQKREEARKLEEKRKADEKKKAQALAEQKKREQAKAEAEQKKREQAKAEAEQKKREQAKADAERKKREAAEDKKREAQLAADRQKNLERMMGQAGASGGANAKGTAQQASGPSASYGGKVAARVKPNIVFTDAVAGNPRAEVEIRLLPDGTIVASKLTQSSGNRAWDEAVLRAVERTGTLPRDVNGTVPSTIVLGFRPQD